MMFWYIADLHVMHDQPINSMISIQVQGPDDRCSDLNGANSLCTFVIWCIMIGNYIGNSVESNTVRINIEF